MVDLKTSNIALYTLVISFFHVIGECSDISDKEYSLMPDVFHLDDYDKCMRLTEALYCTFTFNLSPINYTEVWSIIQRVSSNPKNYRHDKLRHGICVTTNCANTYSHFKNLTVEAVIEKCYNQKFSFLQLKGNITNLKCDTKENAYPIDEYDMAFGLIMGCYIIFVIFASCYEGIARYQTKDEYKQITGTLGGRFISSFSIPKNWHRLGTINYDSDIKKLRGIQGIRFYNTICVVLVHTVMFNIAVPVFNTQYVETLSDEPLKMFILNYQYGVQTFFVISGWLLSFHFFHKLEEKSVNSTYFLMAFINRIIRLTPVLAVVIALESTWLVHFGRGPNWDLGGAQDYRNCRKNWWTNLLAVNNYVDIKNLCLLHTWYQSADTQLYILSLLLLWLVWKMPSKVKLILSSTIILGLFVQGAMAYYKNYDIVIYMYPETLYDLQILQNPIWYDMYISGQSNIGGYAIGLTFGYIFCKYRNQEITVKKIHVALWWFSTFGLCVFIVLIANVMYSPNYQGSIIESTLYWALGKNIFALGMAVMIMGFTLKIGWFARWFCEWKPVVVLGRLSYSTYLIHVTVLRFKVGSLRQPIYIDDVVMLRETISDASLCYAVGLVVCLLFEMPISALQKLIQNRINPMKPNTISEKSSEKFDHKEPSGISHIEISKL